LAEEMLSSQDYFLLQQMHEIITDPNLSPQAYGYRSLKDVLRRMPDIGFVRGNKFLKAEKGIFNIRARILAKYLANFVIPEIAKKYKNLALIRFYENHPENSQEFSPYFEISAASSKIVDEITSLIAANITHI